LAAGRRERCAGFVADKQGAAELVFKRVNARADGRLADVEPIRRTDEVSRCNNREKGSGQFGVHGRHLRIYEVNTKAQYFSFVKTYL
jgi:hypothetical protein